MHIEDFRYKKSEYYRYTDLFRTVAYCHLVAMHIQHSYNRSEQYTDLIYTVMLKLHKNIL